jgi:ribulose bisphosphate carboxylase small subunit
MIEYKKDSRGANIINRKKRVLISAYVSETRAKEYEDYIRIAGLDGKSDLITKAIAFYITNHPLPIGGGK